MEISKVMRQGKGERLWTEKADERKKEIEMESSKFIGERKCERHWRERGAQRD